MRFLSLSRYELIAVIIACLSLLAMALGGLEVRSVRFRSLDGTAPEVDVPPPYMKLLKPAQEVHIELYYRGYGNTHLRLTPRFCLGSDITINAQPLTLPQQRKRWCNELVLDLKDDLQVGPNDLILTVLPPEKITGYPSIGISVNPVLFGYSLVQSVAILLLIASSSFLLWHALKRRGWDDLTCLLLLGACSLFLSCLYAIPDLARTLDLEKHAPYIQYTSEHFFAPFVYKGPERWQPFPYYMLSAIVARLAELTGVCGAWVGVRLLSLMCYTSFLYFGIQTLRLYLQGRLFYVGVCLLIFWPSGLFSAAWVYNDVLFYPLYAGCFYYTLRWYQNGNASDLRKALIYCGLAFSVKTTALVPAGILGITACVQLATKRKNLSGLLDRPLWSGWLVLVLGIAINLSRAAYYQFVLRAPFSQLSGKGDYDAGWGNFLTFDITHFITHPFFIQWNELSAWHILFTTMLFTNVRWHAVTLASCLMALLFLMIIYILGFLLASLRGRQFSLVPIMAGLAVPVAACITFTVLQRFGSGMDSRYVQPALVAFVLAFMLVLERCRERGYTVLYRTGLAAAALFPLLSLLFFYQQL